MGSIRGLPRIERPRERLAAYGPAKLADHELLAIILGSGTRGASVLDIAKRVCAHVEKGTVHDIRSIKGLGAAKYAQIQALIELGKRFNTTPTIELFSPEDVWRACADIRTSKKEHFLAFYLDTHDRLIERRIISIGTLDASLVHPREVFEPAIALSAASIIVAHNHPSGSVDPSPEDREVTTRLREAGTLLGIRLTDHIIVTAHDLRSCL